MRAHLFSFMSQEEALTCRRTENLHLRCSLIGRATATYRYVCIFLHSPYVWSRIISVWILCVSLRHRHTAIVRRFESRWGMGHIIILTPIILAYVECGSHGSRSVHIAVGLRWQRYSYRLRFRGQWAFWRIVVGALVQLNPAGLRTNHERAHNHQTCRPYEQTALHFSGCTGGIEKRQVNTPMYDVNIYAEFSCISCHRMKTFAL